MGEERRRIAARRQGPRRCVHKLLSARGSINAGLKGTRREAAQEIARRAAAKTSSSIASVRRPVKVFCWLG